MNRTYRRSLSLAGFILASGSAWAGLGSDEDFAAQLTAQEKAPVVVVAPAVKEPSYGEKLASLNAAIVETVSEFNTATTKASLVVSDAVTNAVRAVKFACSAGFEKLGSKPISIGIPELRYSYPEAGGEPRFSGKITAAFNLLDYVKQSDINEIAPAIEEFLTEMARSQVKRYGDAATVEIKVVDKTIDAEGNIMAISVNAVFKLDLSRLPEKIKPEDELFAEIGGQITLSLSGGEVAVQGVLNPGAREFTREERGLKEGIDELLARDPKAMAEVRNFVKGLSRMAK